MKIWFMFSAAILAAFCVFNLNETVRRVPPPARVPSATPTNPVLRHEQRLATVRRALETHGVRGTLGYVADLPPDELAANAPGMEEYFLTQFALVPWVIDARFTDCDWALLNLHTATIAERTPPGFAVVAEWGDGLALLRRTTP